MNDLQQSGFFNADYQSSPQSSETAFGDLIAGLRRRIRLSLFIFLATIAATVAITASIPKTWKAEVQLKVIERVSQQTGPHEYRDPIAETPDTPTAMLQSQSMWQRTVLWYQNQAAQSGQTLPKAILNPGAFSGAVTVTNPKDSDLINLDVDGHSRDEAINVANAIALAFVQWNKELAQQDIKDTEKQLESELIDAKASMETAINAEYFYRDQHNLVNINDQENNTLSRYNQDELNVSQVQQDLASQQAALASLTSQLSTANHSILSSGTVRDESFIQTLQSQLSQAEAQRAVEAQKVTPLYPGQLPVMDAGIKDLKQRLTAAVNASIGNGMPSLAQQGTLQASYNQQRVAVALDQAKLAASVSIRDQDQKQVSSLPDYEKNFNRLDLAVQTATQRFQSLETALNDAKLQLNSTSSNVQITQDAVAGMSPYKPVASVNIAIGTLLGFVLVLVTTLLLEQADRRVYDVQQVERYRLGPVLGVLPQLNRTALVAAAEGRSVADLSEHFSIIRTNLLAVLGQQRSITGRLVLVTSAVKGEGKSLILAELARTLADAGKKIIAVDGNFRNPSLTEYFEADHEAGLTNILLEKSTYDDVITPVTPNLSVIHGGPLTNEPTRLTSTPPYAALLNSLKARADIILVDSSACDCPDPLLIAPHFDYVIHVIAAAKSNESSVRGAMSAIAAVTQVGIIVNYANLKQLSPHQLVNAAAKAAFWDQREEKTLLDGQLRIGPPDVHANGKARSGAIDIIPSSKNAGDNR
jgi:capsular exopolysaccharide synthesis family protein